MDERIPLGSPDAAMLPAFRQRAADDQRKVGLIRREERGEAIDSAAVMWLHEFHRR